MKTKIYIISGFLGAGKTTLINHLISTGFINNKSIIVENDFGDENVDYTLLKDKGIKISALNSGCICCTLAGDFVKNMLDIINKYNPEKIIIEPSGVGKLSDIIFSCSDERLSEKSYIAGKITIADAKRCNIYYENFGEFFEDQIGFADSVLLSRAEDVDINAVNALIKIINPLCPIITLPFDKINGDNLFSLKPLTILNLDKSCNSTSHGKGCTCGCNEHHNHTHVAGGFETITIRPHEQIIPEKIDLLFERLNSNSFGMIARAKGILKSKKAFYEIQYVSGEGKRIKTRVKSNFICFIGKDLDKKALSEFFK